MNMNQIRYVLEVSKSASMREAAERLFVTQPALSARINDLEEELGIKIFERSSKGISLTEEGSEFISYAKQAAAQYELLENRYLSKDSRKEIFSFSTQHYVFAREAFANVIKKFAPDKYSFMLHETKTHEVLENVRSHKSEVGVISYSGNSKAIVNKLLKDYDLVFTPLMERGTSVYLWKDHPLADRKILSLADLKEYPCITFNQENAGNYYLAEEPLPDHDFDKQIKSDDRASTMELIAVMNGYSIGIGMLADENAILKGLVSIKLKEEDPLILGYVTRRIRGLSKYGEAYIAELEKLRELS